MAGTLTVRRIGANILSPLGFTASTNFDAVVQGHTRLQLHSELFGVPEPFCASMFNRFEMEAEADSAMAAYPATGDSSSPLTLLEKLCILSAIRAMEQCNINPSSPSTLFILSTTKGNVDLLESDPTSPQAYLPHSARRIADFFGNSNEAPVVSNACISGVCAQIQGVRALLSRRYTHAVVIGADLLSRFIVSGFQSFKALSIEPCRPYDLHRTGLNLGEAVATLILEASEAAPSHDEWVYAGGSIHNDANHISGPSRTGEGSYRVLRDLLALLPAQEVGFVNVHGTSTPYNDEMESIALHRAGLLSTPVNALKGYFGHTLGAAGLLETILSMEAADRGVLPATKGYSTPGTSYEVNISAFQRPLHTRAFIKLLSGFGGTNAGIAYRKGGEK